MRGSTERVSVSLDLDAIQALSRIKDQCDPELRALTSRIVSAAIVQLYEQSIGQNLQLDIISDRFRGGLSIRTQSLLPRQRNPLGLRFGLFE